MAKSIVNTHPFPFHFDDPITAAAATDNGTTTVTPLTKEINGAAPASSADVNDGRRQRQYYKTNPPRDVTLHLPNVRGRIPSIQASRLRTMMLEAHEDPTKILAHCCSFDGLSSRLVEEAGFPMVFLAGYPCASSYG